MTLYAELRVEFQNEFTSFRNSGEGAGLACFSMLPEFVLDYWQFTTHYSLCFAYAKRPLIFVLLTGTSFVRFCFGFIQQKSLLICPANSLKFEQTFFRITWRSLHSCQNPRLGLLLHPPQSFASLALSLILLRDWSCWVRAKLSPAHYAKSANHLRKAERCWRYGCSGTKNWR